MTGHIRRRGERSWELKFDIGADPVTGKRRVRYASFKGTKRDAEIELSRLVTQNAAGEGVDPSKATVAEFVDRWERDWASVNVSPKNPGEVQANPSTKCRSAHRGNASAEAAADSFE
jgi:hypothetical protein